MVILLLSYDFPMRSYVCLRFSCVSDGLAYVSPMVFLVCILFSDGLSYVIPMHYLESSYIFVMLILCVSYGILMAFRWSSYISKMFVKERKDKDSEAEAPYTSLWP